MYTLTVQWRIPPIRIPICFFLLFAVHAIAAAQDFRFRNPQRVFGPNLREGALYRYSSVKNGTDALVRINSITNGTTLTELDQANDGYENAFQPAIRVPGNREGYVEFLITFVNRNSFTPQTQPFITVSGVDIDGAVDNGRRMHELVGIDLGGGFVDFDMVTGELSVQNDGSFWLCRNISANDFSGIDTSEKALMFSAMHHNVASFILRTGIDNRTTSAQSRNASIYFARFSYPHSALPVMPVVNFKGTESNNRVDLEWQLTSPAQVQSLIVEKSTDAVQFSPVQELRVDPSSTNTKFSWTDLSARVSRTIYYRLKIVMRNGQIAYTHVLPFPSQENIRSLQLYPTIVTNLLTIHFSAKKEEMAYFELTSWGGKVVYRQKQQLREGINNFTAGPFRQLKPGVYAATLKTQHEVHSRQIIIGVH